MMKISLRRFLVAAALVSIGQCLTVSAQAAGYDDQEALSGLKEVKVAFDVTTGDAKALLGRLNVIDETRQSLIRQGVTPHFVITFRGPATKLIQTDASKIKPEDRPMAAQIAAKLNEMRSAKGVENLEQCAVAVREQGTKPENVIPAVKVVGNAWISLMAYQSRGYAYIAP